MDVFRLLIEYGASSDKFIKQTLKVVLSRYIITIISPGRIGY